MSLLQSLTPKELLATGAKEAVTHNFTAQTEEAIDADFVIFSIQPEASTLTLQSKEMSQDGRVGAYLGQAVVPYEKVDLSVLLPYPLKYAGEWPVTYRTFKNFLKTTYAVLVEDGDVTLLGNGDSGALANEDTLLNAVPDAETGTVTFKASSKSGRFKEGTKFQIAVAFNQGAARLPDFLQSVWAPTLGWLANTPLVPSESDTGGEGGDTPPAEGDWVLVKPVLEANGVSEEIETFALSLFDNAPQVLGAFSPTPAGRNPYTTARLTLASSYKEAKLPSSDSSIHSYFYGFLTFSYEQTVALGGSLFTQEPLGGESFSQKDTPVIAGLFDNVYLTNQDSPQTDASSIFYCLAESAETFSDTLEVVVKDKDYRELKRVLLPVLAKMDNPDSTIGGVIVGAGKEYKFVPPVQGGSSEWMYRSPIFGGLTEGEVYYLEVQDAPQGSWVNVDLALDNLGIDLNDDDEAFFTSVKTNYQSILGAFPGTLEGVYARARLTFQKSVTVHVEDTDEGTSKDCSIGGFNPLILPISNVQVENLMPIGTDGFVQEAGPVLLKALEINTLGTVEGTVQNTHAYLLYLLVDDLASVPSKFNLVVKDSIGTHVKELNELVENQDYMALFDYGADSVTGKHAGVVTFVASIPFTPPSEGGSTNWTDEGPLFGGLIEGYDYYLELSEAT